MKQIIIILFVISSQIIYAQGPKGLVLKGKLTEEITGQPVEYATVSVMSKADNSLLSGGLSETGGVFEFEIKNIPSYALIEFLSFSSVKIDIPAAEKDAKVIDLGEIKMKSASVAIDEVTVTAEKSTSQFMLDRKVFNVGQDLGSRGGTALELLNNVPSLTVDVEGGISLRGNSNVRVMINGRPSGLMGMNGSSGLRSIPANMIERVEVITNPSAKYEAEGMTGIINIVLKKDAKGGFNGSFEVTGGLPRELAGGANLNYRSGSVNFFVNYNIRQRKSLGSGENYLERTFGTERNGLFTDRNFDRDRFSQVVRSGLDFFITPKQSLTASVSYNANNGENNSQVSYRSLTTAPSLLLKENVRSLNDYILRNNFETEKGPRLEYALDYKKEFDKKGREWTANLQYQNVNEIEASDIDESRVVNQLNLGTNLRQRTQNDEGEKNLNFQTDYKTPVGQSASLETGLRTTNRTIRNDYFVEEKEGEVWKTIESLTNDFKYDEHVHAGYAIFNDKKYKYSYQLGLRYEYTDVTTTLLNTNQVNPRQYHGLFPSGFFNYQITPENQVQLSYSRRIRRPGFRDLNPFFSFSDRINIRTGNPDLDPQYTNSYEASYLKYFDNANFGVTGYFRKTSDVITSIKELKEDETTLNFPVNLGYEENAGLEILGSYSALKWLKIDGDLNLFHNRFYGAEEKGISDTQSFAMNSRINSRISFAKNSELQVRWNYAGPRNVPQGKSKAFTSLDLAYSMDINKDLTLTANVRDVFNQRRWRYERFTDTFYEEGDFQMARNSFNITFNYRVNAKKERPKSRQSQEEQGGMMF